jgi:hypothetical protein
MNMNQIMTLISNVAGPADMLSIGNDLKQRALVKEVRISVSGPELVLIDTDDFTMPEYKAYSEILKFFLDSRGIKTIETQA